MNSITITIPIEPLRDAVIDILKKELYNSVQLVKPVVNDNVFLTRKETAIILGISLKTLRQWTLEGVITGYRYKSRVRYKKEEVLASAEKIITSKYRKGFRF
ncbi:MAG TPA: helix-turn-helix domain-containing protein [Bacteroidales bacterium]|nr:helix-turn-helix domain-containing protein [Bacteroidales bacterium]